MDFKNNKESGPFKKENGPSQYLLEIPQIIIFGEIFWTFDLGAVVCVVVSLVDFFSSM